VIPTTARPPAPPPEPDDRAPPPGGQPAAWPHQEPDSGRPDATPPAAPVRREAISSDADLAAYQEAKDRADTEDAVQRAVSGAIGGVQRCFERNGVAAGDRELSVRVHRSGRVLSASVEGVASPVNQCVEQALSSLRVSGMKTDTLDVTRTIRFTR